jgi:hypothetical protein
MSEYRLSPEERETVITMNDGEKIAKVFTWQRRVQKRLAANPQARLLKEGIHKHRDDKFMEFEIPRDLVTVRIKRVLSEESRERLVKRMRQGKADPATV